MSLYRLTSSQWGPDPAALDPFSQMTDELFAQCAQKISHDDFDYTTPLLDYPRTQEAWNDGKKWKYEHNIMKAITDPSYNDYVGCFTLMTKSGEVYRTSE